MKLLQEAKISVSLFSKTREVRKKKENKTIFFFLGILFVWAISFLVAFYSQSTFQILPSIAYETD